MQITTTKPKNPQREREREIVLQGIHTRVAKKCRDRAYICNYLDRYIEVVFDTNEKMSAIIIVVFVYMYVHGCKTITYLQSVT